MKVSSKSGSGDKLGYGLLSDIEILKRLVAEDDSCVFVSPLIRPKIQLGPSSLDLHLGPEVYVTHTLNTTHIDLTKRQPSNSKSIVSRRYISRSAADPDECFVMHPGEFALASTLEFIRLPLDIAGRLEGRSSLGRLGLQVHATAGYVDPGFEGTLTFELINAGRLPLEIPPGLRVAQICFFKVSRVQIGYLDKPNTKYGRSLGVTPSKLLDDEDLPTGR